MKRLAVYFFVCAVLFSACGPALAQRDEIPRILRFTQEVQPMEEVREKQYVQRTYPNTANAQVNQIMRSLIDQMTVRGRAHLPTGKIELMPSYLDVGSTISRTSSQWMSFLTIARVAYEREQTYVDFDARVYDMKTGTALHLTDLFAPDSPAWDMMAQAVREQLSDYFAALSPKEEALAALCTREALENASFTLTPAKIELHYRADALYRGKPTLMHVKLYYSAYRPLMTELGQEITDNSRYKMIALTYDDGGARSYTNNVVNKLRLYGANATFFIVGTMMASNHDVMCRQQDAGYAMASHNYEHVYTDVTEKKVAAWQEKFNSEMDVVIGLRPAYMRAPGGNAKQFISANVNLPMIQWSINPNDSGNENADTVAANAIAGARDGGVMLLHDLNPLAYQYTEALLENLESRNFLCVTVDELFDHYGVPLLPNQAYTGCEEQAERQ